MKIRVQQEGGAIEVLELIEPISVHEGKRLNRLSSAEGLDHYFTLEGFYDGWGTGDVRLLNQENVEGSIEAIQDLRVVEPPKENE